MFSLTLRTKPEAKLPKAARHSCGVSLGQVAGDLPVGGWSRYRGPVARARASARALAPAAASNLSLVAPGTNGRALLDCIEIELQTPGALS
jgi:hypothetical protein